MPSKPLRHRRRGRNPRGAAGGEHFPSPTGPPSYNDASQATALASAGNLSGGLTNGHCTSGDYEAYTHDPNGNRLSLRKRDTSVLTYSYDNLGRLTEFNRPGTERSQSFEYDLLGRMTAADQINASIDYSWDALGRPVSHADGGYGTTSFQYDGAGRRSRMTWTDGFYVTYDYLANGAVSAIRENGATSGAGVLATYAYDDLGRRASITRGNGATTSYGYDAVSRLSQLVQNPNGTSYDLTLDYGYNPAGQIVSTTRSNDGYAWGGHVNRNVTDTINGLNQVTASGGTSISHDANGNISAIGGVGYAYDSTNRLLSAGTSDYLSYDPAGRLFAHERLGIGMTYLLNSGDAMIAEYDAYTGLARRYVYGPGIDEPLVWYEGSGTSDRRYHHADERGSVIALSNGSGNVTDVNAYDEYGIPASGNTGRFQYTGQQWLAEIGMYHYRNRVYNPDLGRFMQTDPIGYWGGMNLYAYVLNDPVNFTDPLGLTPSGTDPWEEECVDYCGENVVVTAVRPPDRSGQVIRDLYIAELTNYLIALGRRGGTDPALLSGPFNDPNVNCGNADCSNAVVTGRRRARPSLRIQLLRTTIAGLERWAELLEPPPGRGDDETYWQCVRRISAGGVAMAVSGGGGMAVGSGSRGLYPRGGFAGGGQGTSITSITSRGVLGGQSMGFRMFGTGNLGGMFGRGASAVSRGGGASIGGFGIGVGVGSLVRCQ